MPVIVCGQDKLSQYLKNEFLSFLKSIRIACYYNEKIFTIGACLYDFGDPNKFRSLIIAKSCGLNIPSTVLSQDIQMTKNFFTKKRIVTKPFDKTAFFKDKKGNYSIDTYTKEVSFRKLKKDCLRFPNKFQEFIDKLFEIRIFFIEDEFFGCALIDKNLKEIDIRKVNQDLISVVPFLIPFDLRLRILKFTEVLGINIGCIDLICDKYEKYIFLEINPYGQYDMISLPCNYNLDGVIAEKIKKSYEQKNTKKNL
jgi:glutathione synthase/RimK-type ligase-like ATP-grasp enzyme